MIIASIRIDPVPDKRQSVIDILMSIKTLTSLKHGCLSCEIYEENGDGQKILYIEEWQERELMYQHIRSNLYLRVLNAVELACKPPEIHFYEDSETTGIGLIEDVRGEPTAQVDS